MLADICESNDDGKTPVPIDNVSPEVFRLLLSYIYGMKISNDDMKSHAREIINAADRFGGVNLKLEAEASIVEDTIFTLENVKELLLFAESKNCALLKEAAMDYIVENKADMDDVSFVDAPGTLLNDMLVAFIRSEKKDGAGGGIDGFASMRVSELRKKAHEKGLNVDGSREMLITALKLEDNEESDEE
jgi:hypothetical protein